MRDPILINAAIYKCDLSLVPKLYPTTHYILKAMHYMYKLQTNARNSIGHNKKFLLNIKCIDSIIDSIALRATEYTLVHNTTRNLESW